MKILTLAGTPVRLAAYLLASAVVCLVEDDALAEVEKRDWVWVVTGVLADVRGKA